MRSSKPSGPRRRGRVGEEPDSLVPQIAPKSVSSTSSCIELTKTSKGHRPSSSSGHPRMPVNGTGASLRIRRTCLDPEHVRTWSCMLVANGQILRFVSLCGWSARPRVPTWTRQSCGALESCPLVARPTRRMSSGSGSAVLSDQRRGSAIREVLAHTAQRRYHG